MAYSLATSYAGNALVNGFNWVDTRDYSNGYVRYQSQVNAAAQGLFAVDQQTGVVRIGVDHTNPYDITQGRPSIRIESKEAYNKGLFIGDFLHMPPSQCGVWPAFWAYGPNWPAGGEIDIIEGANTAHRNIISAHTSPGCELGEDVLSMATGEAQTKNCDVGQQNIGCGYAAAADDVSSYGDTFNALGGGIYAMQWDDEYIKVWHFNRASVPADITAKQPRPEGWGKPQAVYGGSKCDVKSHFRDMSIVLNINFCGDYGNAVWASDGCTAYAPTCSEWVAKNPTAFASAYWDVNYIDAYVQEASNGSLSSSAIASRSAETSSLPSGPSSSAVSITGVNNETNTRPPVAGSSSALNFTDPATTTSSSVVNTPIAPESQSSIPTTSLPSPNGVAHLNPASLNDFSYLGCFGSSSDFASFEKVADSADMNLRKCTELCKGKKYAGVYDTTCYCASELDADTRVSVDACDTACPGDSSQFCGGRVKNGGVVDKDTIGATANVTVPQTTSFASGGAGSPVGTGSSIANSFRPAAKFSSVDPEGPFNSSRSSVSTLSGYSSMILSSAPASATPTSIAAAKFVNSTSPEIPSDGSSLSASRSMILNSAHSSATPTGKLNSSTSLEVPSSISSLSSSLSINLNTTASSATTASDATAKVPVSSTSASRSTAATIPKVTATSASDSAASLDDVPEVVIPVYPIPKMNETVPAGPTAAGGTALRMARRSNFLGRRKAVPLARKSKTTRSGMLDRREAADFLLTVYAAVAQEEPPKPVPGMGKQTPNKPVQEPSATNSQTLNTLVQEPSATNSQTPNAPGQESSVINAQTSYAPGQKYPAVPSHPGQQPPAVVSQTSSAPANVASATGIETPTLITSTTSTVVTTVTYQTVYPSNPTEIVTAFYVTTIVKAHCGCTETPPPVMTVSMSTKVVSCSACGRHGESTVTIVVPCEDPIATPTPTPNGSSPPTIIPQPPSKYVHTVPGSNEPPAPNGNAPPPSSDEPPTPGSSVPPASNKNVPPTSGHYEPPTPGSSVPPASDQSVPPTSGHDEPPTPGSSIPPASDENVPPPPSYNAPPKSDNSVPPTNGGNEPPAPNNEMPPPSPSNKTPPATNSGVPPAPNSNAPPVPNDDKPAASSVRVPPPSSSNVSFDPPSSPITVSGASGSRVTSLFITTMLAMVLLL
ncbi:hypothetical protein V2A60_003085 [Cordyceps javanica]|uniref:Mixed-linked glucanase n=1 Tax=Cordyceps javanica TaxID=43265 RepID=A0A545V479_9HYPO|nr:mixed-linked glucanase [Cordyceps javanica]TQW07806.1 mixed-linked glucanase [Cordyceps javanica]